jgi:hypothetical protein
MPVEVAIKSIADKLDGQMPFLVFDRLDVKIRKIHRAKFKSETTDGTFIIIPWLAPAHKTEDENVISDKRSAGREVMIALAVEKNAA